MSEMVVKIEPAQATALSVLARGKLRGAKFSDYSGITQQLKGDALNVAQLMYGVLPPNMRTVALKKAVTHLNQWAKSLPK